MRHYCRYKFRPYEGARERTVEGEIIGTVYNSSSHDEEFIILVEPESSFEKPYYKAAPIYKCTPIKKLSRNETK